MNSYGKMPPMAWTAIRDLVQGKVVVDLGCGSLGYSFEISKMGARQIFAVDKEPCTVPGNKFPPGLEFVRGNFEQLVTDTVRLPAKFDVAFVSWPSNHPMRGLIEMCDRADIVIHMGCNWNETACGFPAFYRYLCSRELLQEHQHPTNHVGVVGKRRFRFGFRRPTFLEFTGIENFALFSRTQVKAYEKGEIDFEFPWLACCSNERTTDLRKTEMPIPNGHIKIAIFEDDNTVPAWTGTVDEMLEENYESDEVVDALLEIVDGGTEARLGGGAAGIVTIRRVD